MFRSKSFTFKKGVGPLLKKIKINKTFLEKKVNFDDLTSIKNAIVKIKRKVYPTKDLIGFCGAPWTLACYMIERSSSKDFSKTRTFLWNDERTFIKLINKLTNVCIEFLEFQNLAGASVLMIFDTWSSMIPDRYWAQFGIDPIKYIVSKLREKKITCPIIGFPFKSGEMLIKYSYESSVDIISIDWKTNLDWALKTINKEVVTQGNLDPVILSSNNLSAIKNEVSRILDLTQERCHIFNVGHGLTPEVKIENVRYVINLIDNHS